MNVQQSFIQPNNLTITPTKTFSMTFLYSRRQKNSRCIVLIIPSMYDVTIETFPLLSGIPYLN